jgi:hypothetical protein
MCCLGEILDVERTKNLRRECEIEDDKRRGRSLKQLRRRTLAITLSAFTTLSNYLEN